MKEKNIETHTITPNLTLLNLQPPIPGYEKFIGAYLFRGEKTALVDVGPRVAVPNLLASLAELGMSPEEIDYIILTHIHVDHAGGIGTVIGKMSRAKVLAHGLARRHLIDPSRLWEASVKVLGELALNYGCVEPVPEERIMDATDQMKIDLGRGLVLEVHLTPGHATHHLSLFDRASGVLIAGEAAGVCLDGVIRVATAPPFKLEEYLASIDKLISLKPQKVCYGHFGCYEDAPERLKSVRQKLLAWHEIVRSAVEAGKNQEDIFSELREKDRDLDYLSDLNKDEYHREHALIVNSIQGLSASAGNS